MKMDSSTAVDLAKSLLVETQRNQQRLEELENQVNQQCRQITELEDGNLEQLLRRPASLLHAYTVFQHELIRTVDEFCRHGHAQALRAGIDPTVLPLTEQSKIRKYQYTVSVLNLDWTFRRTENVLGDAQADRIAELAATEAATEFPGTNSYHVPLVIAQGRSRNKIMVLHKGGEKSGRNICLAVARRLVAVRTHELIGPTRISFGCCDFVWAAKKVKRFNDTFGDRIKGKAPLPQAVEILNLLMAELSARERAAAIRSRLGFLYELPSSSRDEFYRQHLMEPEVTSYLDAITRTEKARNQQEHQQIYLHLLNQLLHIWRKHKESQCKANPTDSRLIFEAFSLRTLHFELFGAHAME